MIKQYMDTMLALQFMTGILQRVILFKHAELIKISLVLYLFIEDTVYILFKK